MKGKIIQALLAVGLLACSAPDAGAQSWSLTGNAGTSGTNFVGTTDAKSLRFRTKNVERMRINHNGLVGIGTPSPAFRLDVKGKKTDSVVVLNTTVSFAGEYDAIAIHGESQPQPGFGIGVHGLGNYVGVWGDGTLGMVGDGLNTGVQGQSIGADTTVFTGDLTGVVGFTKKGAGSIGVFGRSDSANFNYGVWGQAPDTAGPDFAVVAIGDVYAWRFFQASDRKLKKDIVPYAGALDRLMQLNTATYTFNQEQYPGCKLPGGKQIGFMADEVDKVFPEFIKHGGIPAGANVKERGGLQVNTIADVMAVNYVGFIPVLAQAIKEQKQIVDSKDAEIDALKAQMSSLEARLAALEGQGSGAAHVAGALLEQNQPNPFREATDIRYTLPDNGTGARLTLTDVNGQIVRSYVLGGRGHGTVTVHAGELAAGTYTYSLLIDGRVADSKVLLLTK